MLRALTFWLIPGFIMLPYNAFAGDAGCKGNPALTGPCYVVWGEVGLSADVGLVLGLDPGSHPPGRQLRPGQSLIIRSAPNSEKDIPRNVGDLIDPLTTWVHGRYEVCPIPAAPTQFVPGELIFVCIESGSHLKKTSDN